MEDDGEGITDEIFMDYVREFLNNNLDEDDEDATLFGEKAVDKVIQILKNKNDEVGK